MRNDLDHLPAPKRQELARVLSILCDDFDRALAGRNAAYAKTARLLKVVLFGSYARGDWVVDPDGGYMSDFDILMVVNHEELTDVPEFWRGAEDHLLREMEAGGVVRTPVNLIVHTRADVNAKLKRGRPFFVDIVRDGILLHDTRTIHSTRLRRCRPRSRGKRRKSTSTSGSRLLPSSSMLHDTATSKGR